MPSCTRKPLPARHEPRILIPQHNLLHLPQSERMFVFGSRLRNATPGSRNSTHRGFSALHGAGFLISQSSLSIYLFHRKVRISLALWVPAKAGMTGPGRRRQGCKESPPSPLNHKHGGVIPVYSCFLRHTLAQVLGQREHSPVSLGIVVP